jgi:hypothetical protein
MTDDSAVPDKPDWLTRLSDLGDAFVLWAIWLGLALSLVGLVDGVSIVAARRVVDCPDGKIIPQGASNLCYSHPRAGLGTAIAAISVMLAIVIVFSGVCAATHLRARSAARTPGASS